MSIENPNNIDKSEIPLEMYDIPGSDAISMHAFSRYLKDKSQDESIAQRNARLDVIYNAAESEVGARVVQGLEDPYIRQDVARMAPDFIAFDERMNFIKHAINNPDREVRWVAALMVKNIAEFEKKALQSIIAERIETDLRSPDQKDRLLAIDMAPLLPSERLIPLLKEKLIDSDIDIQERAASIISEAPEEEVGALIKYCLEHSDSSVYLCALNAIIAMRGDDSNEREEIRKMVLQKANTYLESDNISLIKIAGQLRTYTPAGEFESIQIVISKKIRSRFNNTDSSVRKEAVSLIRYADPNDSPLFLEMGINDPDREVQIATALISRYVHMGITDWSGGNKEKDVLFQKLIDKGLADELVKPLLYNDTNIDDESFSRHAFAKTGSGTTLIGGELKDKTIIRHISPLAFAAWQKAYEDYDLWRRNGFDYVPIEPIQSYRFNKEGGVDVYSGILDLNFTQWKGTSSRFKQELDDQIQKIKKILDDENVMHGHPHNENFCLRFFRDEQGRVDFNKKPRIYLIDFDRAVSYV